MKKTKERCGLFLLLFILLLSGCGAKTDEQSQTDETGFPTTVSYANTALSISGNRAVYVEDDGIMHIRDVANDVSTVLCTKPNCEHASSFDTGESDCEAAPPTGVFGASSKICLHGSTVFQFYTSSENPYETVLYVSHVGQSGRTKAATLPYVIVGASSELYFQGNKLYFTGQHNDENEDGTQTVLTRCILLEMDLDTYEVTELDELSSESYMEIARLDYSDGILAYECYQKDEDNSDMFCAEIYFYNTKTQEKSKFDGQFFWNANYIDYKYYIGYADGVIYFVPESADKIQTVDVATGEENTIISLEKGKRIYECNMNYDVGIKYTITDEETKETWGTKDKKECLYSFEDAESYPVAEKYQNALSVSMITKDTVYYNGEDNDSWTTQWISLDEYIDK